MAQTQSNGSKGKSTAPLLPAYLMVGTDEVKQRTALQHLNRRLETSGDVEFNREDYDGTSSPEPSALRSSLDTLPFGADFRLVVIRGVDKANKDVTEEIIKYLKNPNPTTVLAMTAVKQAKNTRLYKAVAALGKSAILDCSPRKASDLPAQVMSLARGKGKIMDQRAAELLIEKVGDSTTMIDNELVKLAVAVGDRPAITADDVQKLVARVAEVKPWPLLDAICQRDVRLALQQLNLTPEDSAIGRLTLIVGRLRQLIAAKALANRGQTSAQDLASALNMQYWQVKNYPAWSRNFTEAELEHDMDLACDCEQALKSHPDKKLAMQRFVIAICVRHNKGTHDKGTGHLSYDK